MGVVLIGLIVWGGYELFKPAPSEEAAEEGEKEEKEICVDKCGDGVCQEIVCQAVGCPCAETVKTCPEDCEEKERKEEPIIEEVKDCGSVVNTHIFMYPQDMTVQEKESLNCINEALVNCSLSKIEFIMGELPEGMPVIGDQGEGIYEIQGKQDQNCLISRRIFEPPSYKTCKIPIKFITDMKITAEQQNQSDMLFVGAVLFPFSFGKATNVQTGEEVIFECE